MSRTPREEAAAAAAPDLKPFDLVPPAERPALSAIDYVETEEHTNWFNPFDYDVAVKVHVGSKPMEGAWDDPGRVARWRGLPPQLRREMQTGERVYVIPARGTRSIPSEFDQGIQQTECLEPECASRKMYCRVRAHDKQIIGGLYPRLINRGTQRVPLHQPPKLHYALDDERARAKEALERAQRKLAESTHQQGLAMVAAAEYEKAKEDMAAAEARLAGVTDAAEAHKQTIEQAKNPKK